MRKPTGVEKLLALLIYIVAGLLVLALVIAKSLEYSIPGWIFALVIGPLFVAKLVLLILSVRGHPGSK